MSKKTPLELGKRERQIVETVQRLGEASVAEVREHLADPPSYSAVRTMLGLLADKGWLRHRAEGKRYLYRPAAAKGQSRRNALRRLLGTFFGGSAGDAMAALLDISATDLTDEQLQRLTEMIEQARREKRKSF
jgi:BlaI family transcriptional regulator, penicillinase repressor